jgi:hypothetical protein
MVVILSESRLCLLIISYLDVHIYLIIYKRILSVSNLLGNLFNSYEEAAESILMPHPVKMSDT